MNGSTVIQKISLLNCLNPIGKQVMSALFAYKTAFLTFLRGINDILEEDIFNEVWRRIVKIEEEKKDPSYEGLNSECFLPNIL